MDKTDLPSHGPTGAGNTADSPVGAVGAPADEPAARSDPRATLHAVRRAAGRLNRAAERHARRGDPWQSLPNAEQGAP